MTLAELSVPMLVAAPTLEDAANPEVVRLVALARAGDRAAFGRLIEDHLTAARRVALAAVGQISDADEAVQEASVTAWRRLDALHEPGAFRGWFMRIVWRKALDRRRSMRTWFERFGSSPIDTAAPTHEPAATDAQPDELAMSRELASAIAQVVRALPRRLRDPFLLAASGDHRYEEIATMLGTPIGTVKWRISEALRSATRPIGVDLNIDARPFVSVEGPIQLELTLNYSPGLTVHGKDTAPARTGLNQSLTVVLQTGKPLIISQSADPVSDRKVVVEVKATVLK